MKKMSESSTCVSDRPLDGRRVAFIGKLGGVTKREAHDLVRRQGGVPVDKSDRRVDLIVIGADEIPLGEDTLLDESLRAAAAADQVQVITETQLWQDLGLLETEQNIHRLYTPAMLAELVGVPISIIRRWHRRGLIVPVREVNRLAYFDFQEIATARRLAQLLAAGASPATIEKKLETMSRFLPEIDRPMAQLSVIVEGRDLLLRQGEGLVEPGGQMRFDFDATPSQSLPADEKEENVKDEHNEHGHLSFVQLRQQTDQSATPEQLLDYAAKLEEEGSLEEAIEVCRTALMVGGPNAEVYFLLAEMLYRIGDVTAARERYYAAVELDEDYVEARANLGCVLAETGQLELAVAAFYGTLEYYQDYPDVHYHLARTLDELGRANEATEHWSHFLTLAPESPWADEARGRLTENVF